MLCHKLPFNFVLINKDEKLLKKLNYHYLYYFHFYSCFLVYESNKDLPIFKEFIEMIDIDFNETNSFGMQDRNTEKIITENFLRKSQKYYNKGDYKSIRDTLITDNIQISFTE